MTDSINWTKFDQFSENTCYCWCETVYRSHTKLMKKEGKLINVSRKPCPKCKKTEGHLRRVSFDPEVMVLK